MDLYKDFMPQNQSSRILWHKHHDDDQILLDVDIEFGFKFFVKRYVVTLVLGSRPKQGLARVQAKREARQAHFMLYRMQGNMREWTLTLPSEFPLWKLESDGLPNFQRAIVGIKTHWIKKFLIILESSQNLDV